MAYILNGELVKEGQINLPIDKNGSFWYGDGFFEAMKYGNQKLLFADEHWERIVSSCNILKMTNPIKSKSYLKECVDLLAKEHCFPTQRIKLTFWRNSFQSYLPEGNGVNYLLTSYEHSNFNYPLNMSGLKMDIYTDNLKSISLLGNVKSTSSQLYVLATLNTQRLQMDDSILLNTQRNVIETTRSNIFLVVNHVLYTPLLSEGCLDGIMRRVLLEICNQENILVKQEPISLDLMNQADEIFTSSSIRGVQWVGKVKDRTLTSSAWSKRLSDLLNMKIKKS